MLRSFRSDTPRTRAASSGRSVSLSARSIGARSAKAGPQRDQFCGWAEGFSHIEDCREVDGIESRELLAVRKGEDREVAIGLGERLERFRISGEHKVPAKRPRVEDRQLDGSVGEKSPAIVAARSRVTSH